MDTSPPEYLMVDLKCDGSPITAKQGKAIILMFPLMFIIKLLFLKIIRW